MFKCIYILSHTFSTPTTQLSFKFLEFEYSLTLFLKLPATKNVTRIKLDNRINSCEKIYFTI